MVVDDVYLIKTGPDVYDFFLFDSQKKFYNYLLTFSRYS